MPCKTGLKIALLAFCFQGLFAVTTFKDAVRALGPGNSGKEIAREIVTVLNLMSEKLEYDERAQQFFHFMNDALEDFDFSRIYNSPWLTPAAQNFRQIVLTGKNTGSGYRVSVGDIPLDGSRLGNTRAEYRMRQNSIEGDTTYTTILGVDAILKRLDAQAQARFLENLLKVISPDNIAAMKPAASAVFPEITGEPRKVLDQFAADFPRMSQMLSRYTELKSFANVKNVAGKVYTEMSMRGRFRMDALAADYPKLKGFLNDIRKLFVFQFYLSDAKGQNLMSFIINTQTEEFFWGFNTANGKLLPTGKDGTPVMNEGITLAGQVDHKFYVALSFFVNVYGLKINSGNIGAYLRYQANYEKMSFYAKLTHMPEGKISGALFGVLPTWVIDLSIPSDLQTLMNRFSQTVFKANNGEGSKAEISWKKRGGDASLHASASTEFLENRFIRIGMKIWVRKFRPNEHVQEDIRVFIGRFSRAILDDLAGM